MIAYVTVINNVCCIQKDLRHLLLYYCWRPPRRSDDIRNMFFFISCDIEYSFSVTHVYLLIGVIYAMTCMYIYGNKAFWNWNWNWNCLKPAFLRWDQAINGEFCAYRQLPAHLTRLGRHRRTPGFVLMGLHWGLISIEWRHTHADRLNQFDH